MAISIVRCPECNTGLKATSPAGFSEGQTLTCPKCQTMFAVEAEAPPVVAKPVPRKAAVIVEDDDEADVRPKKKRPRDDEVDDDRPRKKRPRAEDDDEDDRPRKKKKKRKDDDDDEGFRYTKSPIRIVVISILLIVLAVLGVLLYQKIQRERDANKSELAVPSVVASA